MSKIDTRKLNKLNEVTLKVIWQINNRDIYIEKASGVEWIRNCSYSPLFLAQYKCLVSVELFGFDMKIRYPSLMYLYLVRIPEKKRIILKLDGTT